MKTQIFNLKERFGVKRSFVALAAFILSLVLLISFFIFSPFSAKADIRITSTDFDNGILTITVEYDALYEKQAPKTFDYEYEGVTYSLKLASADYKATTIRNRGVKLDADAYYDQYAGVPPTPETQNIKYTDPATGETVKGKAVFSELEQLTDYVWTYDLYLPAKFYNYDAKHYSYHEMWVENNDAGYPEIHGKEWYILEKLGVDPNYNVITSAEWSGEAYPVEGESVSERKAVFKGKRYVADFVAHYDAELKLPNCDGFTAKAIYQIDTGLGDGSGDGTDISTDEDTNTGFFDTTLGKAVIVVGILILIIGIVLILLVIAKKRKKKEEDNPEENSADEEDG